MPVIAQKHRLLFLLLSSGLTAASGCQEAEAPFDADLPYLTEDGADDNAGPGPDDLLVPIDSSPLFTSSWSILDPDSGAAHYGYAASNAGDVDSDGYDDVLVGARDMETSASLPDEGRVFLYRGSASGLVEPASWSVAGAQRYAYLGTAAVGAGDVNGDGYDDILTSAFRYDDGETDEGRLLLYLGSASGPSTTPSWTWDSNQAGSLMGFALAGQGDLNCDGYDDIVAGAYNYDAPSSNQGAVFVFYGSETGLPSSPSATIPGYRGNYSFGYSVAIAGDVDNDGCDDLLVGAAGFYSGEAKEGAAYLYRGSAAGISASWSWRWQSDQAGAQAGRSVSAAGDIDQDGYDDFLVGIPYWDHGSTNAAGRFVLFYGNSSANPTRTFDSESYDWPSSNLWLNNGALGFALSAAGDIDADTFPDFLVSQRLYDNAQTDEGRVLVMHGSASGPTLETEWESDQSSSWLGYALGGGGDIDADGADDYLMAALMYDNPSPNEGAVFVMRGVSDSTDADEDGDPDETDCDDENPLIYTGAAEICNSLDDDCDTLVDDLDPDVSDPLQWFQDLDLDTFGDAATALLACENPGARVQDATDCDDTDPDIFPGATEICNAVDDDCDTLVDDLDPDVIDQASWFQDLDEDTWGDPATELLSCENPGDRVEDATDCDDTDPQIHPLAVETCNTLDDDCDTLIDDLDPDITGQGAWYADADLDTHGDPASEILACANPGGLLETATDCDDTNPSIHPGAAEICDTLDNDCDLLIDDGDPGITGQSDWYADNDNDAWGVGASLGLFCSAPASSASTTGDCDDTNPSVNPGAVEDCGDLVDQDCDSELETLIVADLVAGDLLLTEFMKDPSVVPDTQGEWIEFRVETECAVNLQGLLVKDDGSDDFLVSGELFAFPGQYVVFGNDILGGAPLDYDYAYSAFYLSNGADEIQLFNGATLIDELVYDDGILWDEYPGYSLSLDQDYENITENDDGTKWCLARSSYSASNRGTPGQVNDDCLDICRVNDTWYQDLDEDGYGDLSSTIEACRAPTGYLGDTSDCDDSDPHRNPDAIEYGRNELDDDCDEEVDEIVPMEVHVIDVGQGDAILVISPEGLTLLLDSGGEGVYNSTVGDYLEARHVWRLDYTLVSHFHDDHVGGMDEALFNHAEVIAAWDHGGSSSGTAWDNYLLRAGSERATLNTGDTLDLAAGLIAEILYPTAEVVATSGLDENDRSIVLRLEYGDVSFLLGGDCSPLCEATLVADGIDPVDIYKVHHHGSSTSSTEDLLDALLPSTALLSVGPNSYGHPASTTLSRIDTVGASLLRTDVDGDILVITDGVTFSVETEVP